MSASREKQRRKDTVETAASAQEPKKKSKALKWVLGIVIALVVICLLVGSYLLTSNWFASHTTAVTVGSHSITPAEYNYHYREVYYQYSQMLGDSEDTLKMLANSMIAQTNTRIQQTYAVYDAAMEDGFTLPEEDLESIDQEIAELDTTAAQYNYSGANALLAAMYGTGSSKESYRQFRLLTHIVADYTEEKFGSFTDEEVAAYYAEHKDTLGDESDYRTVNVRHILVEDEQTAHEVLQQYLDGEKTEDAFAELATVYSTDNADDGGLYENVTKGQMVEAFNDWIFDEARKTGDTDIVETEYGYHVMYFVGEGENTFDATVRDAMRDEAYSAWIEEKTPDYPVTENSFGMSLTSIVKPAPAEETEAETAEDVTEETAEATETTETTETAETTETTETAETAESTETAEPAQTTEAAQNAG